MPSDTSHQHIIDLAAQAYFQAQDLPFAVFVTTIEGIFLKYNEECRLLFELPDVPDFKTDLCSFYLYPNERSKYIDHLYLLPKTDWLRNTTLDLIINEEIVHVRCV